MHAMQMQGYGGPDALRLVQVPQPVSGAGEVLVRVHCASVNPVDWKRASGQYRLIMPVRFPATPGYDVAGTVVSAGPGVPGFAPGMRVHARIAAMHGGGCAEFALVGARELVPMPEGMAFADAAALPLAGMTALQALRDGAHLPLAGARERVLVVGASGGVGHLGVQVAKATGAWVAGVCSGRNAALVRALGADAVLDYTQPGSFVDVAPFDVVLDCVAGDPSPWLPLMSPDARYVSVIPGPGTFVWQLLHPFSRRRVRAWMLKTNGDDLRWLDALWQQGGLSVVIDGSHPLERLGDAWQRSMSGRAVGKIVVDVA
jgi:NADPH:quinone reductase-like Zn-dependent oxidoreductase